MWTLKTVDTKMNIEAEVPGERLMMHVTAVLTNGEKDVEIPFTIENKDLMDKTLLSIVDRINQTEQEVAITPNGEAYTPEKKEPEPVPQPTPAQIFQMNRVQLKSELMELKNEVDMGLATPEEYQIALHKFKKWQRENKVN